MSEKNIITVPLDAKSTRLDRFLAASLPDLSRSRLKNLIAEGHISYKPQEQAPAQPVTSPSRAIKPGEIYYITLPEAEPATPEAEAIPLDIVYEDTDLIVINKAAGMVVHPAAGSPTGTLVNALLHHCGDSLSGIGGVKRPGIVHRIDKDTSGLLVVAKNDKAHNGLAEQFAAHTITRRYLALCRGHIMPPSGRIEGAIARHPVDRKKMAVTQTGGKWAATHYKTLQFYSDQAMPLASQIECRLETGRTHQVRVHMAHIGHALIGDPVYSRPARFEKASPQARAPLVGFKRQALHAKILGFLHPISGAPLHFEIDAPHDMELAFKALAAFAHKI